jgi:hypothetical protein
MSTRGGSRKRNNKLNKSKRVRGPLRNNRPLSLSPYVSQRILLRTSTTVSADATGVVSYRFSLRNLTRAINGSGTYDDAVNLANIYDEYKPIRMEFQFLPLFAVNAFGVASLILATDYDDDDTANLTSNASAFDYSNRCIFDPRRPKIYHPRMRDLSSGFNIVAGVQVPVPVSNGYLDFANIPVQGVLYLRGQGFPNNLLLGEVYLSMLIHARGQR